MCVCNFKCGESDCTINHKESHTKCTKQCEKFAHFHSLVCNIFFVVSISAFFSNRFAIRCRQKVWMHTETMINTRKRKCEVAYGVLSACSEVLDSFCAVCMNEKLTFNAHTQRETVNSTLSLWLHLPEINRYENANNSREFVVIDCNWLTPV